MTSARKAVALLAGAWLAGGALAGTTVDLTAEASRPAANDMVRATVFAEASGNNPADLARRVNQDIAEGLKTIKARTGISVKSGRQSTFPVYAQNQKIESWRMHSELVLESRDAAALSELLGQLQQMRLAIGSVSQLPAPETRRKVEDEATRDAIGAFRQRAAVVADVLGKPYKIRHLSIQQGGQMPPMPVMRASRAAMAADAAPPPLEAGESLVTTTVSGQIELAD
ncbi:MAG: SIMPL domain-containing protein [Azonexus sp.]|nr:SIMPL domain-containing protein [Azonexus sp.]